MFGSSVEVSKKCQKFVKNLGFVETVACFTGSHVGCVLRAHFQGDLSMEGLIIRGSFSFQNGFGLTMKTALKS